MPTVRPSYNRWNVEDLFYLRSDIWFKQPITVEEKVRQLWDKFLVYQESKKPKPPPKPKRPYYRMNERW